MSRRTKFERRYGPQSILLGNMFATLRVCESQHDRDCQCRYLAVVAGNRGFITVMNEVNPVASVANWERSLPAVLVNLEQLRWIRKLRRTNNVQRYALTRLGRMNAATHSPTLTKAAA